MKLDNLRENNFDSKNFVFEGIDAKINPEQMQKMMELISSPYKDSISSIVREITSNCFDSHREAGVKDAVVITFDKDQSGEFIQFSDVGTGLSPERIKNIYINYLSSTKEESNDFIGAFGMGSKSPLSYRDMFFINTVYEGIRYEYIMRKGDTVPRIEKINETPIDKRNGTDIKIYIKQNQPKNNDNYHLGDLGYFIKAIENQLKYFDNVYVENKLTYIFKNEVFNSINNFKLYEGKHFISRSNSTSSLEICLGSVYYPIDYKIVFPKLSRNINLPVALKFDIGDLMVTFSREDIKYNTDTISKIREKTKLVIEELMGLYIDQSKEKYKSYNDYVEYLKNSKSDREFTYISSKDNNLRISLLSFLENFTDLKNINNSWQSIRYINTFKNSNVKNAEFEIKTDLAEYIGKNTFYVPRPYFKPFENINLPLSLDNYHYLFKINDYKSKSNFQYSSKRTINNNKHYIFKDHILKYDIIIYLDKDVKVDQKIKTYVNSEILKNDIKNIIFLSSKRSLETYKVIIANDNKLLKDKSKWRETIKLIQSTVEKSIIDNCIKISDIEKKATKEWYSSYKKKNNLNPVRTTKVKNPDTINVKTFQGQYTINDVVFNRNVHIHTPNIDFNIKNYIDGIKNQNKKKDCIFVTKDNSFYEIYYKFKTLNLKFSNVVFPQIHIVSKSNLKMIENEKINLTLDDFIKENKDSFVELYFYTNYMKTHKNFFNKLVENNQNYINDVSLEKSLFIYDLFKNTNLYKNYKDNQSIISMIKKYIKEENNLGETYSKLGLFVDEYKALFNKLIEKTNLQIDIEKECEKRKDEIIKSIEGHTDDLKSKYDDLYKLQRFSLYTDMTRNNKSEKHLNLDYKLIDKEFTVKNSFIYKLDEYVKDKIEKKSFNLSETENFIKSLNISNIIQQNQVDYKLTSHSNYYRYNDVLYYFLSYYIQYLTNFKYKHLNINN